MWKSDPQQFPELTPDETEVAINRARMEKGKTLFQQAYARQASGVREFPDFNATSFRAFIEKRGKARAMDEHWTSGDFFTDEDNQNVIKLLCLYFTGDPRFNKVNDGKYSLHKGIYLCGPGGVGKTVLMDLCDINPFAPFTRHDCQIIAGEFAGRKEGGQQVIDHYSLNTAVLGTDKDFTFGKDITGRFFDDLGQEDLANHFGNEKNVMAQVIENRYRQRNFHLTHFTSNHTIDELDKMQVYGYRVPDRLREMCNVIEFPPTAKSRRK